MSQWLEMRRAEAKCWRYYLPFRTTYRKSLRGDTRGCERLVCQLGAKTMFDFRSTQERECYLSLSIPGATICQVALFGLEIKKGVQRTWQSNIATIWRGKHKEFWCFLTFSEFLVFAVGTNHHQNTKRSKHLVMFITLHNCSIPQISRDQVRSVPFFHTSIPVF